MSIKIFIFMAVFFLFPLSISALGSHEAENIKETSQESQIAKKNSNILVVYYSATGTTKEIASTIESIVGCDIFEVEPLNPYTSSDLNWTNDNSRVSREYEDERLREIPLKKNTVADWDSYDTVFIGYPIWWGIAAWPLNSFIKMNDFSGKHIIPFCTSLSSGVGDSAELLKSLSNSGNWEAGIRFSRRTTQNEISSWAREMIK